jgi:hypothetical protein
MAENTRRTESPPINHGKCYSVPSKNCLPHVFSQFGQNYCNLQYRPRRIDTILTCRGDDRSKLEEMEDFRCGAI